jgi:hypothetical protein
MVGRKSRRVGKLGASAGVVRARFEPHVARGGEAGLGGGHVRVNERVKSPKLGTHVGKTLSRRDPMKVAQHFGAGLAFFKTIRPGRDDRSSLRSLRRYRGEEPNVSIVPTGRTWLWHHFPALKCWATFIGSLRDESSDDAAR